MMTIDVPFQINGAIVLWQNLEMDEMGWHQLYQYCREALC